MKKIMRRVVIAGGSGTIGRRLVREFAEHGISSVVLSRSGRPVPGAVETLKWDGETVGEWAKSLEGSIAVVNLAGETIAQLWTDDAKKRILGSRVNATRVIGEAILRCELPPRIWVNGSAIGFYGDTGEESKTEVDPGSNDFLGETCRAWEAAQTQFDLPATKLARIRIGVVLSPEEGMLPRLAQLAKMGLGSAIGDGKQWISWIHEDDLVSLFRFIIEHELEGVWNGVSPNPIRNADFMGALRAHFGRPWVPPVPPFMLGAMKGITKTEPTLALISQRVDARKATDAGFSFGFDEIAPAIRDILSSR